MKRENLKYDIVWAAVLGGLLVVMLVPPMAGMYQRLNANVSYATAFVKFFIMASMGEYLAKRIRTKQWQFPSFWFGRALVWGFLGIAIALAFQLFSGGVLAAAENGFLPKTDFALLNAFMISAIMNLIFAPVMMGFHRFTDTWFDLRSQGVTPTLIGMVEHIDWEQFFSFVVAKTIPFFWIPAHTITFLLPGEYRVLMAALLSIALGLLLAIAKPKV